MELQLHGVQKYNYELMHHQRPQIIPKSRGNIVREKHQFHNMQ